MRETICTTNNIEQRNKYEVNGYKLCIFACQSSPFTVWSFLVNCTGIEWDEVNIFSFVKPLYAIIKKNYKHNRLVGFCHYHGRIL